ncbi:hypothetical protein Q9966_007275 [Columba livia]|nr:hypothetical protein Q9966_007275 [Columba livia]
MAIQEEKSQAGIVPGGEVAYLWSLPWAAPCHSLSPCLSLASSCETLKAVSPLRSRGPEAGKESCNSRCLHIRPAAVHLSSSPSCHWDLLPSISPGTNLLRQTTYLNKFEGLPVSSCHPFVSP